MTVTAWEYAARAFEPGQLEHPDLLVNAGPAALASALDPLSYIRRPPLDVISDAWLDVHHRRDDRLAISLPSQVGKTTTAVDWAIFWWLILHPHARVAVVSYGDSLAVVRGRAVRRLINSYGERYGLKLDPATRAAHDWSLSTGGGLLSIGVGSGFTGRACDVLAVDDPHKDRVEADSVAVRKFVHEWWSAVAVPRMAPDAPVVIVATRWHCLLPGSDIITSVGITGIDSVRPGSTVLTSAGPQPVLATAAQPHTGDVVSIRTYGYPKPLLMTPEHQVLTPQGWCKAGDLRAMDWLTFPIPQGDTTAAELRSLIPAPPQSKATSSVPRMTGARIPVTRDQLQADLQAGLTYEEISQKYGRKTRHAAFKWAALYGITRPANRVLTGDPTSDPDFWRVVGYWLAEGTITAGRDGGSRNVVRWSFSLEEQHLVDDIREVLARYGLKVHQHSQGDRTRAKPKHSMVARCSSAQLASLLGMCGAGARNKLLPEPLVRLPAIHAQQLVRGYWLGDGCVTSGKMSPGWARITSVSIGLLTGFYRLLPRLGVAPLIMRSGRLDGLAKYEMRFPLADAPWFGCQADPITQHGVKIEGSRMLVKIRAMSTEYYDGPVYDIQTPAGDFVANNFIVHNCDDLIGRVTQHEGTVDKGGRWRVISMPALCTDPKTDPLRRGAGDPLPHPRIPEGDTEALLRHWQERRTSMTPRDWQSICQCDPQPPGGTLLTGDELRNARHLDPATHPAKTRIGVAVDPSGGGRDTAGIIGGFLGEDGKLWFSHDRSMVGPADKWARAAAQLAADIDADLIVYESNYGADMARAVIRTAWEALIREGVIAEHRPCPLLQPVHSRRGKFLRAEPVAQAFREDRIRTGAYLPEMESEWITWQPTSAESPGRIDASVHLAWALLPPPGSTSQVAVPTGPMPSSGMSPLGGRRGRSSGMSGFGPLG